MKPAGRSNRRIIPTSKSGAQFESKWETQQNSKQYIIMFPFLYGTRPFSFFGYPPFCLVHPVPSLRRQLNCQVQALDIWTCARKQRAVQTGGEKCLEGWTSGFLLADETSSPWQMWFTIFGGIATALGLEWLRYAIWFVLSLSMNRQNISAQYL